VLEEEDVGEEETRGCMLAPLHMLSLISTLASVGGTGEPRTGHCDS
jgi:hypothetical protein